MKTLKKQLSLSLRNNLKASRGGGARKLQKKYNRLKMRSKKVRTKVRISTMINSSWTSCRRTNIDCRTCFWRLSKKSRSIKLPISKNKNQLQVHRIIARVKVLRGRQFHPNLCRCNEIRLREAHHDSAGRRWEGIRRHNDGPSLEAFDLTTFERSGYSVLKPGWRGHWANPGSPATKRGVFVYLGHKR
jgi:hypothetical protein